MEDGYPNLRDLSKQMAVWAIDTPTNRATMTELWAEAVVASNDLTLFKFGGEISRESELLARVPTIEMHHPEATALLLIGVSQVSNLVGGFLELGYSLEKRGDTLVAVKQEQ